MLIALISATLNLLLPSAFLTDFFQKDRESVQVARMGQIDIRGTKRTSHSNLG